MKNLIAIVAGEPNSINSEIIAKAWKIIGNKKNLFIIGNYSLLKKQLNKIGIKTKVAEINSTKFNIDRKNLNVLNVPFKFSSIFPDNSVDTKNYVLSSLDVAHNLASKKKIKGFINAPIDKKIFSKKYLGVTEYLAHKNNVKNKEAMLIFNKKTVRHAINYPSGN